MNGYIGKAYRSPEGDGGNVAPDDEGQNVAPVIKVGDKEISQADLQALITGDTADNIKIDVGDGKVKSLKTLRELARRDTDVPKLLAEERAKMQVEYDTKLATEREQLTKSMTEASNSTVLKIADAIREATGGGERRTQPFATKESAIAYINERMQTDGWTVGIADMVGQLFDSKDATSTEMKVKFDKLEKELADTKEQVRQSELKAFAQRETDAIQAVYSDYDPNGDDPFSTTTLRLLTSEKPSQRYLKGKIGIDMLPVQVAKEVKAQLAIEAHDIVKAETEAETKRKDAEATAPIGRTKAVPAEIQSELAKATSMDELRAIRKKVAALS